MELLGTSADPDWGDAGDKIRAEVEAWKKELLPLLDGTRTRGGLVRSLEQVADRMGVSPATAQRKFYAARAHGWKGLVNRSKLPKEQKLPAAFVQYWKRLCEENQRNCRQAHKILIHKWRHTDDAVPGYPTPPPASVNGIPYGWGYKNLMLHKPTKFELELARRGRTAAANFRPLIMTTRVGLQVGQFYMCDDLEHDLRTNYVGVNRQALRPLELGVFDLFSGCKAGYGLKPMIEGDDGAKQKLKERDMRFLIAYMLTAFGFRMDGTTFVVENGTAAIRADLEAVLYDCTGGAIKVQRGSMEGAPALHGWYEGRGKGNFRVKAHLESLHSLVHNVTAMLPGQMGMDRNHSPEELHGRMKVNNTLLKALEKLPVEKQNLLKLPVLHFQQFHGILDAIYRSINARTDHDLEGWEEAGLVTQEYRIHVEDKRWLPMEMLARMPPDRREAVTALIEQPGLSRCRKLAPVEVWEQGRKALRRLPMHVVPAILGKDLAVERRLGRDGVFTFEDRDVGACTFRYLGRALNREGYEVLLRDNEVYQTWQNPIDPSSLLVSDARGCFIGTCRRIEAVRRDDVEALHKAMGDAAHSEVVRMAEYRARHQGDVDQRREDEAWNKKVLAGAPVTPDEKEIARARAKGLKTFETEDLMDPVTVTVEESGDEQAAVNELDPASLL
jgi:hypothetical protein